MGPLYSALISKICFTIWPCFVQTLLLTLISSKVLLNMFLNHFYNSDKHLVAIEVKIIFKLS